MAAGGLHYLFNEFGTAVQSASQVQMMRVVFFQGTVYDGIITVGYVSGEFISEFIGDLFGCNAFVFHPFFSSLASKIVFGQFQIPLQIVFTDG